jgi:transposase
VLIDCPADSGAAETYTADECKMAISPQQKAMSVLWYWETKSVIQVQRRYRRECGERTPGRQSLKRWLKQFQETGSVLHKKGAGRPSVDADTVEMVRETFQRSPSKYTCHVSRELHVPRLIVQRILHRRLKLQAYKIQIVQALEPDDGRRRKEFAMDMLDRIDNDNGFLDRVIF